MSKAGLAVLLLLAGCAHGPARRGGPGQAVVTAEGWAAVMPSDPLGTAKRALTEAQRKAVEKVTGVSVRARTRVEQSVSIEQRIWSDTEGRILSYEVLGEREEGGFHKTRIRAVILREPLRPGGKKSGPLPGDPKVAVVVDTWAFPDRGAAERGVQQALREAGARVVFGPADYVVSGEASVAPLDANGLEGFASYRARLAVELKDPAKDEVIAARSFEASAIDPSRQTAAGKALAQVGRLAGEKLAVDLRSWVER
ncbi:MAG: hypothetical protein A3J82_06720 [Elusimicrobia bacterium RIFOXYA2_FULL_69_6]|nr:MAG: hypothetical protein A3J82_06720 [Elusimicrobia bacterium RIFOXYA2_FULL_69_6]